MARLTHVFSAIAPKKPIRGLPESITVPFDTTVAQIKELLTKPTRIRDPHRIGLFDPTTKTTLKNRLATVGSIPSVVDTGELLVKDLGESSSGLLPPGTCPVSMAPLANKSPFCVSFELGPQISWRAVFVIEYFGPILFHVLALLLRPYLYTYVWSYAFPTTKYAPLSTTQWLVWYMFIIHFVKREIETLFVHRFSAATMPVSNVFRNSAFYWLAGGLLVSLFVYSPASLAAKVPDEGALTTDWLNLAGLALYVFGEVSNAIVHLNLASLRRPGGTERGIPTGYGFGLVTCPNYFFEVVAWIGVLLVSRSWTIPAYMVNGIYYMRLWAMQKEKAYRRDFGDKYKKKRYVMLPGLF